MPHTAHPKRLSDLCDVVAGLRWSAIVTDDEVELCSHCAEDEHDDTASTALDIGRRARGILALGEFEDFVITGRSDQCIVAPLDDGRVLVLHADRRRTNPTVLRAALKSWRLNS